jgi:ParB-like chromosome segregation protein Spo0J
VAAGHRRRVALERAGFTRARCLVSAEGTPLEEAIKVAENDEREDVNPAAQATYYRWLLEHRCDGDVEQLARLVSRKESHVLDRLDLTRGDPAVLAALRGLKITLAVARELNKVRVGNYRALFIHDAISQGATSAVVRRWRQELERTLRINDAMAAEQEHPTPASSAAAIVNIDECPLCHSAKDQHDMEYVRVHRSCRAVFSRQQSGGDGAGV